MLATRAFADYGAGFRDMLALPRFGQTIANTIGLALGSVIIAVLTGCTLAWSVGHSPRRHRSWIGLIPLLPLVVPAIANVTGWIFLLEPRTGYLNQVLRLLPWWSDLAQGPADIYTMPWIIVLTGFTLTGFVYLYVHSSMQTMGTELEAAARVHGASVLYTFFKVTLPLLRPAIVYSAGVAFLLGIGQFTAPLLLGRTRGINVLTTEMYYATNAFPVNYGLGAALGAPLIIAGVVVMFLQRRAISDQGRYVVVTGKSRNAEARGSWIASLPALFFGLVSVVLPIGALVLVALSPYWSGQVNWNALTTANFEKVLSDPEALAALRTSAIAMAAALLVVVPVGFLAASMMTGAVKSGRSLRGALDFLVTLPLGMPAAIFGFAVLYTYAGAPLFLYGTVAIIIVAYITLMIPHAVRPQLSAMISIGREYQEAARVHGAGWWRTLRLVQIPMARNGIAVSSALVVVMLFHEFAASMMVRSSRTQVVGTILYEYYTGGLYPDVAVVALIMVVVTAIGVFGALTIGGAKALEQ
jgi:iron(III) transport system permease protein